MDILLFTVFWMFWLGILFLVAEFKSYKKYGPAYTYKWVAAIYKKYNLGRINW
jgi:hypothetical protein